MHHDNVTEERMLPERDHFALEMDHMSGCVMENKEPLTPGRRGIARLDHHDGHLRSGEEREDGQAVALK